MEQLKSLIPDDLSRLICESTEETLTVACSSLHEFLLPLPQFQRLIGDLTDPELALCCKSKEKTLDFKKKGNECFSNGDYLKAISFYSQALRYAPMTTLGMVENVAPVLYVNRAFSLHKIGLLEECIRDCTRAIVLSPEYAKAWYRRGMANASLEHYEAASCDLQISLSMERSSSGKTQIKKELDAMVNLFNGLNRKIASTPNCSHMKVSNLAAPIDIKLQRVTTPIKGRGMVSADEIQPSSLIHMEEPLAAIVMKPCRETHCHFCFNELPLDVVFCFSCTTPVYCSGYCQQQAGGEQKVDKQKFVTAQRNLSADLTNYMDSILAIQGTGQVMDASFKHTPEHRHECEGAHWSAVLPPDIVLAGRVMVKLKEKRKYPGNLFTENLEFSHNYNQILPDSKLELHLYAIVLSYCLKDCNGLDFPSFHVSFSELILLFLQIKVNSMAIVRMKSLDGYERFRKSPRVSMIKNGSACSVEQVQVGTAIYSTASLFNHSCKPNIHAYFHSRTLFLRSTESVPAWNPLELSYGPQVGQLSRQERQKLLKERYSFKCECRGCSELNLSDIVISAFRCLQPNCLGAVLEMDYYTHLIDTFLQEYDASIDCDLSLPQKKHISKVASMLLKRSIKISQIGPEHCLTCGSYCDLESSRKRSESAILDIKRFKDSMVLKATKGLISDALRFLSQLRSVRHPYSKIVAQAEDILAEAFVSSGEFEHAMLHCRKSIEILEKLYGASHIVIGHELVKLASIQLCMGEHASAMCSIEKLDTIFLLYYGSHATVIFPHLEALKEECKRAAA